MELGKSPVTTRAGAFEISKPHGMITIFRRIIFTFASSKSNGSPATKQRVFANISIRFLNVSGKNDVSLPRVTFFCT
jgi:hypothetical protein